MHTTFLNNFIQNLHAGFRLMTFRRVGLWDYKFSLEQLIALLGLNLLIRFTGNFLSALPEPSFSTYAIPVSAFNIIWPFLLAFFLGKWLKNNDAILQTFIILISYTPLFLITFQILKYFELDQYFEGTTWESPKSYPYFWLYCAFSIYSIAIVWRVFYLVSRSRKFITLLAVILTTAISSFSHVYYHEYQDFWYAKPDYDKLDKGYYAEYEKIDAEALMYQQPALLNKALATLKPQRKRHSDIYFVGFAPYAMQDVFYKEITYAKALMDKRFATEGHSINLINSLKTSDTLPLATGTNLGLTLKHIGKLMDKEDDVLLLYLTSHGSSEHELSVDFYPLALNDLTPAKLKTMLDAAGIKWRVVIVSACYSGGYIKPLQNPNTLIATAAAADKTSFGCGNDFDFTYFGQALFKDQLNHQTSFISALKQANIEIGKREIREEKEPSNPQLSVGKDIEVKLKSLEQTVTAYQCSKNYQTAAKC